MKRPLTPTDRQTRARDRSLHVLARMRRTGESLTSAARDEHVDPRTVHKYVGTELKRLAARRVEPTQTDLRRRQMLVPTSEGVTPATIRGSVAASRLGKYMAAVGRFLRTGDEEELHQFQGETIAGFDLITDPETLVALAEAGSLQLDSIYALPESSS